MISASLVRRRSRMIVALLAIMVGATILSGLGMIYYDVPRQMSSQFRSYGANVIIMPSGDGFIGEQELHTALAGFPSDESEGYTPYRYENTSIHNMPVTLAGIDFDSIMKTSPYWHISGELPKQDGQTLVGAKVADRLGLKIGDSISAVNSFEVTDSTVIMRYIPTPKREKSTATTHWSLK